MKAESKILGRFAIAGMLYGFLVAFFSIGATAFLSPSGPNFGYLVIAIMGAIIWAFLIGMPVGIIVGFVFGLVRRTGETWTLVGFASGGCISLWTYHFLQVIFIGGTPISTRLIVICAIPALLTPALSEALRRDYNSVHQRMPLVARLREMDAEHSV